MARYHFKLCRHSVSQKWGLTPLFPDKYPNLSAMDWMQAINNGASEYDTTLEHVNSMLDYLIDNPEIVKLLIDGYADPDTLKSYKKHIEEYGLYIYGFVVTEDKTGLEKLQNNADVAHIMIDDN